MDVIFPINIFKQIITIIVRIMQPIYSITMYLIENPNKGGIFVYTQMFYKTVIVKKKITKWL